MKILYGYKIVDLFKNLFNSLFIMTEEQEQSYKEKQTNLDDIIKSKFGIFYFFQEEIQKANEYVYNADFLAIKFPSWHCDLGIVKFNTPEINFTKMRDIYEPYRVTIRGSIFLIFVGLAIVYVVKYVLNYGITGSQISTFGNSSNTNDNTNAWHIDGQTSIWGDKK